MTSFIVFLGYVVGCDFFEDSPVKGHAFFHDGEAYANWDAQWYKKICVEGYSYDKRAHSSVAYFPAFPLLGRAVRTASGLGAGKSLLVVSNVALILSFLILYKYVNVRYGRQGRLAEYVLMAFGLLPTTFFFRMAYSESIFILVLTAVLYAIRQEWPLAVIAALVGLATATRPVGVALLPALMMVAWRRSRGPLAFLRKTPWLTPISLWGIASYMLFLYQRFGDPLVFVKSQAHWRERPPLAFWPKLYALATFEPIQTLFDPTQHAHWANFEPGHFPLLSLHVADPFYFLAAIGLVLWGTRRGWLNGVEIATSLLLIFIPYYTSGYETHMRSMGRYASVAVPVYLVIGRLLSGVPGPMLSCLAGLSGFLLGIYTAMFAGWRVFV